MNDCPDPPPLLIRWIRQHGACAVLVIFTAFLKPCAAAGPPPSYRISADPELKRLSVALCFGQPISSTEFILDPEFANSIERIVAIGAGAIETPLRVTANRLRLPTIPSSCVEYDVVLPPDGGADRRARIHRHNGAVIMALDRVLLRPSQTGRRHDATLKFQLPAGVAVSAPGELVAGSARGKNFHLRDRPDTWHGDIVLGQMTDQVIERAGATLRVSIVGAASPKTTTTLTSWITTGVRALAGLYGRLPVTDVQVLIFPLERNDDPVPWGEVVRGGGDAVHLYVDGTRELADLNANWVLCHELSHLLHPYVESGAAWLPEGIASYYQNVLRARAGLLEPRVAWDKLDAGFERGRKQTTGRRSLAAGTNPMMRRGEYMRVYWSGAALALIADVELRRLSDGAMSLDAVLDELARCCLPADRRWPAEELMAKMDEIAGSDVFMRLYERYVRRPEFPDLAKTYEQLGFMPAHRAGDKESKLRRTIMGSD